MTALRPTTFPNTWRSCQGRPPPPRRNPRTILIPQRKRLDRQVWKHRFLTLRDAKAPREPHPSDGKEDHFCSTDVAPVRMNARSETIGIGVSLYVLMSKCTCVHVTDGIFCLQQIKQTQLSQAGVSFTLNSRVSQPKPRTTHVLHP